MTGGVVSATAHNPAVGAPYVPSMDQSTLAAEGGTDTSGRPMAPMLFITDITTNSNARDGDWQWGGQGYAPSDVFGSWKGVVRTVDFTRGSTPTVNVTPDADPATNNWNLGAGADTPPAGLRNEGYGAEIRWNLNDLYKSGVLKAGHSYRFYVMVHDGDQNKSGGDSGQAAYNYVFTPPPPAPGTLSGRVYVDANHSGSYDDGEGALSGVLITLTGTDMNGNAVNLTTRTGSDGTYSFQDLLPGTYTVSQQPPGFPFMPGHADTGTVNGQTDGTVQDANTITNIVLGAGEGGVNFNFGELPKGG
jgi:hypothetical protein